MRTGTLAILMSTIATPWAAGEPIPDEPVVLACDDGRGFPSTVTQPIFEKEGFGATFFIAERKPTVEQEASLDNSRPPKDDADLRYWLENMVWHHRFALAEIRAATGLTTQQITDAVRRFDIRPETKPRRAADAPLLVLPYPGGRHPRIGFLDGAVRPQRETKISVFTPWDDRSYIVLDIPEAIRRDDEPQHGLLYLAHTHVDTMWTKRGIELQKLEWERHADGSLTMERELPNQVVFGTRVVPAPDAVRMEMWLTNGSEEALSNLRVQNCVLFKGAPEFAHQAEETTVHRKPYVARRSRTGNRWIITAWEPCFRTWFNPPCPCMHSDPQFPDCAPGQTERLKGWLSFYEGEDLDGELKRIEKQTRGQVATLEALGTTE